MLRGTFMLAAFCLVFNLSFGQSENLKGPSAKNYKPWKQQEKKGTFLVKADQAEETGPAFKNTKAWQTQSSKEAIKAKSVVREKRTGPKFKNRKPWKRSN